MLPATPYHTFLRKAQSRPELAFMMAPKSAGLPYAPDGFRISYGEAAARVDPLRKAYAGAGYGHGSRVALILQNRPEFLFHWLALNAIGASIVPVNADMRADELRYQMEKSRAELMVALPEFDALVAKACSDMPRCHPDGPVPNARKPRAAAKGQGDDECALLFTSGSTGMPKACILSNFYFMNVADWYVSGEGMGGLAEDCEVSLTPLPFFHMNALGCTAVGMMLVGGCIVALDRFSASRWWQSVADSGATIVHALGVIPAILLQLPPSPAERAHKARFAFSPGVDAAHKVEFERRYGLPILEGWAMTETGGTGVTCTYGVDGPEGRRFIGVARTGMDWRLVDDEGRDVPVGTAGELWVRAAGDDPRRGFFSGYLGDEKATAEAWAGGWFHTGDVMSADDEGRLFFVDRKKSIVRRSGENISALEVEMALIADPAVGSAAVAPVEDSTRGEEVFAFVVTEGATDADAARALQARLAAKLSYHKLPGWIAYADALPVSSTNKLLRGVLKTDAAKAVAGKHAFDLRGEKAALRKARQEEQQ
ncbi:MAG: AMP-binding protein [Pseudorhodobacter sp.]